MTNVHVTQPLVGSWTHQRLLRMLLLSLLLHGAALVALCRLQPAPSSNLNLNPALNQSRFLTVLIGTSVTAQALVIKPGAQARATRRRATKASARTAHNRMPAPTINPSTSVASVPDPISSVAVTPPSPPTSVTALRAGTGIGFSLGRPRSAWAPHAAPTTALATMPPAAMTALPAAASFHAALDSALSAMLQAASPVATDTTCQLTISTRTLSCSNDQLRDWIAARLIWEQLPPPEMFGQPPQLALTVAQGANGQLTVATTTL